MTLIWSGKGNFPVRLILPFMRGRMIRQAEAELDKFRKLVETKGGDFSC
jgi:hypothetical protein